jgi:DNA mismatch repair protein MutL
VAFREITPERRFPLLVLMIGIDPAFVDVNVSPTKSEVRFQREGAVFDAIRHSIKQALVAHGMMPDVRQVATLNSFVRENAGYRPGTGMGMGVPVPTGLGAGALGSSWLGAGKGEGLGQGQGSGEGLGTGGLGRDRSAPADEAGPSGGFAFLGLEVPAATSDRTVGEDGSRTSDGAFLSAPSSSPNSPTDGEPMAAEPSFADFLLSLRVIGQAMKLVILAESPALTLADGARRPAALVMIDQHAAHERILWEKLCGERGRAQIERQHLLVPVTVELDRRAAILLRDRLPEIQEIGFEVEPFGGSADGGASFIIRAIPAAIGSKDPARIFRDLADELVESAVQRRLVPTRELIWITTACRMAIKAGDALSMAEMEELIRQLADCENPYLCPHGRPIVVRLDREATARLFKR